MKIEVAYAEPHLQYIETLELQEGTTAQQAVEQIEVLPKLFPKMVINWQEIGVFGKRVPPDNILNPGDRVEIYRALIIDPKEARRNRASSKL